MDKPFQIEFLDHVAINVVDLDLSANWYEKVLGLKKYKLEKWGEFPVYMFSNKSGIALFPANLQDDPINPNSNHIKIDHFAFHVTKENLENAIRNYEALGLEFEVKDHHYFMSVYTKDPDGHVVELTSLKVDEAEFYK